MNDLVVPLVVGLAGLLMSHPPLEDRIEALRRRG